MKREILILRLFLLLWVFLNTTSFDTGKCSHSFVFPTLDNFVLTAEENTNVSLPFSFSTSCSSLPDYVSITVARNKEQLEETKPSFQRDICTVRYTNGKCRVSRLETVCSCGSPQEGIFVFNMAVTRMDSGVWTWRTDSGIAEEREVVFDITYPPQIVSLKLEPNQTQGVNQSVSVTCLWENGNPPVTARLLDRHGVEMEGSIYSSGQIRYRFPAVGCQNAGLVRCEAPGASHNQTATLLVKCPPKFVEAPSTTIIPCQQDFDILLPVRTYTAELTSCKMKKMLSKLKIEMEIQCFLNGTPPDLTLTVRLDNVSKEQEGQWRLELTNDAGTGHVQHLLIVEETATSSTEPATSTSGNTGTKDPLHVYHEVSSARVDFTVFGSVAVAAIAFTVTVITVSVIRYKKGGRNNELQGGRNHEQPEEIREPVNMEMQEPLHHQPGTESSPSNQSVHSYFEIPDETPPSSPEPPRRCLSPALPNDYLHPSVSHDVTEGTDEAKNVAPLYENTELRSLSQNTGGAASCGNDSEM